jgi:site-specific DNA recombinase
LQSGQTISTITDEFAECGLVTSKGRPLAKSTVHRMLRNPFYIGVISFNKREYPGAHEPLVSTELFNAVQVKLGEHHKKQISHNPLFKGLIQCADCRKMVTWQLQKGRYYGACQRRQEACKHYRMIREDYLENLIGARLHKVDIADKKQIVFNRLKQVIESGRQPYIGQHRLQVMKLIARQLLRCEAMEANLYEDKIADAIDAIAYQTKMSEISERRKQLKSRLHKIEAVEGKTNVCGIDATNVTDLYGSESKAGKRQILSTIFRIRLDGGRVRIENI